ncbi:NAD(P)/FAD-dependent oxidoreductase [Thermoleophilia bacterium SCSIO 60948]|nr:NAD(P)/FAD-dependent oxidoreductase [Thermoleophilia bacterium SCSIO 60948]
MTVTDSRLEDRTPTELEHFDVLIVGAGISGIGCAAHLRAKLPRKSFAILEMRESIGGTWDLFRYPGIRSDSDMQTLGYRFKPWTDEKAIADGPSILDYLRETAEESGAAERIRFGHRVERASWSSETATWTVEATVLETGETVRVTCGILFSATGYYSYDEPYRPEFEGIDRFEGELVHPQFWPEDLDYDGKRVVVIGSGATAVTIVPAMAERAEHVTMLQRSPTYILAVPSVDRLDLLARRALGEKLAYRVVRWKNIRMQAAIYNACRRWPRLMRRVIARLQRPLLPEGYEQDVHLNPRYDPWDQRLCLVPDADLFASLRKGTSSIETDTIETFTERGLRLGSGRELEADVVITATGLNLRVFGGIDLEVDGEPIDVASSMAYRAMMLEGVPNHAFAIGYTNASWTLKVDLVCDWLCRLIETMDANGDDFVVPRNDDPSIELEPILDFEAGYVLRALDRLPKNGSRAPWRLEQHYPSDVQTLRHGEIEGEGLVFGRRGESATDAAGEAELAGATG